MCFFLVYPVRKYVCYKNARRGHAPSAGVFYINLARYITPKGANIYRRRAYVFDSLRLWPSVSESNLSAKTVKYPNIPLKIAHTNPKR